MKNQLLAIKEIVAMFCITVLAIIALINELNAYIYTLAMLIIAGVAGYELGKWRRK